MHSFTFCCYITCFVCVLDLFYAIHYLLLYAQVVAQGNIVIGDELEMTSRQKTFAVALSREMIPTGHIIVYYLRQPEEIVVDVLNFFVNGTRQNLVSGYNTGIQLLQFVPEFGE